jgi:ribosome-associated protein
LNSRAKALLAAEAAEDKRACDVVVLDVSAVTLVSDYFVICSGTSRVQIKAIADGVREKLSERGVKLHHQEGYDTATWILLDYGDVVVHVFNEHEREFYDLERLWGDAPELVRETSDWGNNSAALT